MNVAHIYAVDELVRNFEHKYSNINFHTISDIFHKVSIDKKTSKSITTRENDKNTMSAKCKRVTRIRTKLK